MTAYGSDGYGHPTGAFGGYGINITGYGDPFGVLGAYVSSPSSGMVPDDGGVIVTITGVFPSAGPYAVEVGGKACRSGVMSGAGRCYPNEARTELCFVMPPLAPAVYLIDLSWPGGTDTVPAAVEVVRRHRASGIYDLRRLFPPRRDIGARTIEDEQLLTGAGEFP